MYSLRCSCKALHRDQPMLSSFSAAAYQFGLRCKIPVIVSSCSTFAVIDTTYHDGKGYFGAAQSNNSDSLTLR